LPWLYLLPVVNYYCNAQFLVANWFHVFINKLFVYMLQCWHTLFLTTHIHSSSGHWFRATTQIHLCQSICESVDPLHGPSRWQNRHQEWIYRNISQHLLHHTSRPVSAPLKTSASVCHIVQFLHARLSFPEEIHKYRKEIHSIIPHFTFTRSTVVLATY